MRRPQTLEQSLLSGAEKILNSWAPKHEQRLAVLEALSAIHGGFDIEEFWDTFNVDVWDRKRACNLADHLRYILDMQNIPFSLAIAGLAREPLSVSEQKKNGVFYTDYRLAKFVAQDCASHLEQKSNVADIAAGSGILLVAIADIYHERFPENYDNWLAENVFAFDMSENALRGARAALSSHASSVEAIKRMCGNWKVCDSLLTVDLEDAVFDIVVGNPPWGKVKLSLHSYLNSTGINHVYGSNYGDYDTEQFLSGRQNALDYSKTLKQKYSLLGDAEPDLYMAFLQRATCVLKPGGHLSYLVPAGLIRSQGTEPLRRYLISQSRDLTYYLLDNRANFFEIDSRFKFLVVSQDKASESQCNSFSLSICSANNSNIKTGESVCFNIQELEAIRPDLTIPEVKNQQESDLFFKIYRNGRFWKDEWQADVSREVDMTNDREDFHQEKTDASIPVIEGRMVQQFRFGAKTYVSGSGRSAVWAPSTGAIKPQFYIDLDALNSVLQKRVLKSRVGYCDIAGQTNERAMMSAIIPPNVVCGNKVPTIVFRDDEDNKKANFFVGITNSFVFDWLLRRILSTTVNYFLLFSLPMPNIDLDGDLAKEIVKDSETLSKMGAEYYSDPYMGDLRAELDAKVALAYGLDFSDLEVIMQDFPLLDRSQPPIDGTRSTMTRDTFLSAAAKLSNIDELIYEARKNKALQKNARAYIPTEMTILSGGIANG